MQNPDRPCRGRANVARSRPCAGARVGSVCSSRIAIASSRRRHVDHPTRALRLRPEVIHSLSPCEPIYAAICRTPDRHSPQSTREPRPRHRRSGRHGQPGELRHRQGPGLAALLLALGRLPHARRADRRAGTRAAVRGLAAAMREERVVRPVVGRRRCGGGPRPSPGLVLRRAADGGDERAPRPHGCARHGVARLRDLLGVRRNRRTGGVCGSPAAARSTGTGSRR